MRDHGSREELSLVKDWQAESATAQATTGSAAKDGSSARFIDLKDLLA